MEDGVEFDTVERFSDWLAAHGGSSRELWAIIFKKATGKQRVSFDVLLEEALCWGWVDVQTKSVDRERYGIRFVPRKTGSNWSAINRAIICRLIRDGRMQPAGTRVLPVDLSCPEE